MTYRRHITFVPKGIEPRIAVYVPDTLSAEQANQLVREATRKGSPSPAATIERPFHAYLGGGDDNGYSLLPTASETYVGKTHDVEFVHSYYGRVRATYHCYTYKLDKHRFYSWGLESAEQLDPDAPRPAPR